MVRVILVPAKRHNHNLIKNLSDTRPTRIPLPSSSPWMPSCLDAIRAVGGKMLIQNRISSGVASHVDSPGLPE